MSIVPQPEDSASVGVGPPGSGRRVPFSTVGKSSSTRSRSEHFLRRFFLQSAARDLVPREAVAKCLRCVIPVNPGVDVIYTPLKRSAHYGGLMICKSVWLCPVCAAKITERRRQDLSEGLKNWYALPGVRRVLLVTFTLSHTKEDNLSVVKRSLVRARSLLVSGRKAKIFAARFGIVGMVRSLEVTYGKNGWHPHLHVLYFFDSEIPIIPFEQEIKRRWGECVATSGKYAAWEYGCNVRYSDKEVANYVAKFGVEPEWKENEKVLGADKWSISHEVAKGPSKVSTMGGRSPLELLNDYAYGDQLSGALWLQYAVNFKGSRQLCYSPGLRDLLGLDVELSDAEIAMQQDEIGVILAQLNREQWKFVLGNDVRGELLQVASCGDSDAVRQFLLSIGVFGG